MKQITIEVDDNIQSAFINADETKKQELKNLVTIFLQKDWANKNLIEVMEEIANNAQKTGLTPEILAYLLIVNIAQNVANNPDYQTQVVNNPDQQNKRLAIEKLIRQAINQERRNELTLYRNYASDQDFKKALENAIIEILNQQVNNIDDVVA